MPLLGMYPQMLCLTSRVTNVRYYHDQWRIQKFLYINSLSTSRNPHSCNSCFRRSISPFPCLTTTKHGSRNLLVVRAVLIPEDADESNVVEMKSSSVALPWQLGGMFCLWYLLNIYFNIYNKQVLRVYPFPSTITAFQFGCGSLLVLLMWAFNLHPKPKLTRSQFAAILPLAIAHAMGNLLTNVSLGKVAVSFTHTIKAMEPFFTVLLSVSFLGERPNLGVVFSLVPIVGGVALASLTEASFDWLGFGSAMASNLTNQSRNVLSKTLMVKEEEGLDNINLFSMITLICFVLLFPAAILIDGIKFSPSYFQLAAIQGLDVKELCVRALVAGLCFHTYQQVSYMILGMVSAVTHSVGNCLKRVVVIVSSVIFFQTPISPLNSFGGGKGPSRSTSSGDSLSGGGVVKCSCGNNAMVRKVKQGPNMGQRFYGCQLWPDTKCDFFRWIPITNVNNEVEELRFKVFEKDVILCEKEHQEDLLKATITKLEKKKESLEEDLQQTKMELRETRIELMKSTRNESNYALGLLGSWILFGILLMYLKH